MIQRNLPLDVSYELIDSYYNGGIEAGAGECCQNCGRYISNVAIVKSVHGSFHIGMDCAETLTGIKNSFCLEYQHKARFAQAKQARATLLKMKKEGCWKSLGLKTFTDASNFYKEIGAGRWHCERVRKDGSFGGYHWKQYPAETWGKYVLPMIKDISF